MSVTQIVLYAGIPALAMIGGLMLVMSMGASAPLFGLYLSLGAWMLVLAFAVLPYLLYRQWRAGRRDSE
ncbi:MAG: hypothetical protein WAW96_02855 [Alphaproteobacteria bacterium]